MKECWPRFCGEGCCCQEEIRDTRNHIQNNQKRRDSLKRQAPSRSQEYLREAATKNAQRIHRQIIIRQAP